RVQLQHRLRRSLAPPQQRPNPRAKFGERKRFDDVVVSPQVQPPHPVLDPPLRGQQQHRQGRLLLPQAAQDLKSVPPRQVHVQQNQIEVVLLGQVHGLFAVARPIYRVVFRFQALAKELGQGNVIFGHQESHLSRPFAVTVRGPSPRWTSG